MPKTPARAAAAVLAVLAASATPSQTLDPASYSETETENLTDGTRARKSESEYIWTPGLAIRTCASWLQFTFEHDLHLRDVVSDKVSDATSLGVKFDFNAWRKNTKPPGCGKSS
jgi:hypothetical protein